MRIPEAIELITVTRTKDQNGIDRKKEESKTVYGYVDSVTAT